MKLYDPFLDYSFTALIDTNKITVIDFPNDAYPNKDYSPVESEMLPCLVLKKVYTNEKEKCVKKATCRKYTEDIRIAFKSIYLME